MCVAVNSMKAAGWDDLRDTFDYCNQAYSPLQCCRQPAVQPGTKQQIFLKIYNVIRQMAALISVT